MAKTMRTIGSRRKVWNGTAKKTPGGLTKADLMQNKYGRIVSRKRAARGRRMVTHRHKGGGESDSSSDEE
jgi:hypothetical protein